MRLRADAARRSISHFPHSDRLRLLSYGRTIRTMWGHQGTAWRYDSLELQDHVWPTRGPDLFNEESSHEGIIVGRQHKAVKLDEQVGNWGASQHHWMTGKDRCPNITHTYT